MAGYKFTAAGAAQQLKGVLYRFEPARKGRQAYWDGNGAVASHAEVAPPYADRSWWSGRYALCEMKLRSKDGEELELNDVVASVTQAKNIVKTVLVGRAGTVKEYISDGDYQIDLTVGVVATDGGVIVDEYPKEGMKELLRFLDKEEAIEVHSDFLDLFNITELVVERYSASQNTQGNYQTVTVNALSDEEYSVVSRDY